jgi:osmoprotectant transport system permease protein
MIGSVAPGFLAQQPIILWSWITSNLDQIAQRGIEHVTLTLLAVGFGCAISLPLAIWGYRRPGSLAPVTWVTGVLYTIPAIALISLLIPITGLSRATVVIPLTIYTLFILVRSFAAALSGVPDDAKEAAIGTGFTRRRLLWQVEIPLAMPVILGGLRVATVSTIGLVVIAGIIGQGGFGQFIFLGLRTFFWTALLTGIVLSAGLALLADALLVLVERWVAPWVRSGRGKPEAA